MHDLDRTLRELESGALEAEAGDYELEAEDYEMEGGDLELEAGDFEMEGGDLELEAGDDEYGASDYEYESGGEELEGGYDELEFGQDSELDSENDGEWEGGFDMEYDSEWEGEAVFDEVEEMELAGTLLEITDEQELDYFIKGLLKQAGRVAGRVIGTPQGKALAAVLKRVARRAVPAVGAALGNFALPGLGGVVGAKAGAAANRIFGLELEGLSAQDKEFEVTRRFVRLAGAAAEEVARHANGGSPAEAAKSAVLRAAERHAPGLVGSPAAVVPRRGWYAPRRRSYGMPPVHGGEGVGWGGRSGRWVRRGRRIVLYGV